MFSNRLSSLVNNFLAGSGLISCNTFLNWVIGLKVELQKEGGWLFKSEVCLSPYLGPSRVISPKYSPLLKEEEKLLYECFPHCPLVNALLPFSFTSSVSTKRASSKHLKHTLGKTVC